MVWTQPCPRLACQQLVHVFADIGHRRVHVHQVLHRRVIARFGQHHSAVRVPDEYHGIATCIEDRPQMVGVIHVRLREATRELHGDVSEHRPFRGKVSRGSGRRGRRTRAVNENNRRRRHRDSRQCTNEVGRAALAHNARSGAALHRARDDPDDERIRVRDDEGGVPSDGTRTPFASRWNWVRCWELAHRSSWLVRVNQICVPDDRAEGPHVEGLVFAGRRAYRRGAPLTAAVSPRGDPTNHVPSGGNADTRGVTRFTDDSSTGRRRVRLLHWRCDRVRMGRGVVAMTDRHGHTLAPGDPVILRGHPSLGARRCGPRPCCASSKMSVT